MRPRRLAMAFSVLAAASRAPAQDHAPATEACACALAGDIEHVEMGDASLRPVQVTLASRGRQITALVTLGRGSPRRPREGMLFPESRLVTWTEPGAIHSVAAPGFEPDAALALGAHGGSLVVAYTRADVRGDAIASLASVRVVAMESDGSVIGAPVVVEASAGLEIDSPVVAWRDGFAVVLGRKSVTGAGERGAVTEWLYRFDARGQLAHAPWMITDAQGDDSMGRFRVGLGAVAGSDDLAMSWTVPAAPRPGVWTRRLTGAVLGPATRLTTRVAWGSEIADGGSGVLYRTGGDRDSPVRLSFTPWRGGDAFELGGGWDPTIAFVRGQLVVAGAALANADGSTLEAFVAASEPGHPLRAVAAPAGAAQDLARAVDYDLVATDDGVVVAWIEVAPGENDRTSRRLALARISCH